MFKKTPKEQTPLEKAIDALVDELDSVTGDSEEYTTMVANLETLHKAQALKKDDGKVSADTIAIIAANLGGILLVLNFERANVVASKAMGLLLKTKL